MEPCFLSLHTIPDFTSLHDSSKDNTELSCNSKILFLDSERKKLDDKLASVLDGDFPLIGPPDVIDAIATRNIPTVPSEGLSTPIDSDTESLDEHSLILEDDDTLSFDSVCRIILILIFVFLILFFLLFLDGF